MISQMLDYILFGGLIVGTGVIGVYYGWCKKSRTVNEYILGDRTLVYPTIMSIIITFISPKELLADPTDVVMFGTQFGVTVLLGHSMGCAIFTIFFLPVLASLTGRSLLEYFELRYNKSLRMMAAVVSLLKEACMLPVLIYLPSLVVNKMLGVPIFYSSVALVLFCLFYTTLGGLRAVIWTDTLQYGYYFSTVAFCLVFGVYQVGGVSTVWQDGLDGERIEFFNFGQHLFHDRTNLSGVVGTALYALSVGLTNQSFYQRMVGIKEKKEPIKVVLLSYCGTILSRLGGLLTGLVVYSYFKDCDPLLTEEITKPDQIVAQFVRKIAEVVPGVLGLFCAGVVATSLSTMSSSLNTMACSVHDDLFLRLVSRPIPQNVSFLIMQSVTCLFGIGALAVTPLYSSVKSFVQVILSTNAVIHSWFMGMFISSMANPWVTTKGLMAGAAAGAAAPMWLALSFRRLESQGKVIYYTKLLTTTGCNQPRFGSNFTKILTSGFGGQGTKVFMDFTDFPSKLSAVSFHWYLPIGIFVSLVVSAVVSFCSGGQDLSEVEPKLIVPHLRWLLPARVPQQRNQDDQELVPLKTLDEPRIDVSGTPV